MEVAEQDGRLGAGHNQNNEDKEEKSKHVVHLMRPVNTNNAHTFILLLFWNMSGTTRVSRYQKRNTRKVKTNLDLLEQKTVSGSSISWAICKSAPHPR